MRTFPAAFTAALAKNTGTPVWILELTAGGVTHYLSDQGRSIPTWNGGVTLRPWTTRWGKVIESLGLGLAEILVSDFDATFRIDPAAAVNMEDIASDESLEGSAVTLYLWFVGLDPATDPPQALWSGTVDDVDIPDDAAVELSFADPATLLNGDAGTVVTSADYPAADPDDIGKILPIIFGSVDRIPAVNVVAGRCTTLTAAITTTGQTSVAVLDATGLAVNDYLSIDIENIKITAINGNTLTVLRAQNSTLAATYPVGHALFQVMGTTPFVFIAADQPVTTLDRVRINRGGIDVDVTDLVSTYTGQTGNQYSGYESRAVVVITSSSARLIRARISATLDASDLALAGGTHSHTNNSTSQTTQSATAPETVNGYNSATLTPSFPSVPGTILSGSYTYTFASGASGFNPTYTCTFGSGQTSGGTYNASGSGTPSINLTGSGITSCYITLTSGSRTVTYTTAIGNATVALTGAVNSVADNEIGGTILVDVTATQSACLDAVNNLLTRAIGAGTCTLTGSFPAGYAVNGAIVTARPTIEIIHQLAWECRSWFRFLSGVPRLIVRPDTLTSVRTLTACAVDADHMRMYRRKKTARADLINTITLRYGRDYTRADGAAAYTQTSADTDATSVTDYGTCQKDHLFRCDFITSAAMADSVRDFYLARYARRGWRRKVSTFLDQAELEFGDVITLGFAGNLVGEIMEVRLSPGLGTEIDRIDLVVETNSGI